MGFKGVYWVLRVLMGFKGVYGVLKRKVKLVLQKFEVRIRVPFLFSGLSILVGEPKKQKKGRQGHYSGT